MGTSSGGREDGKPPGEWNKMGTGQETTKEWKYEGRNGILDVIFEINLNAGQQSNNGDFDVAKTLLVADELLRTFPGIKILTIDRSNLSIGTMEEFPKDERMLGDSSRSGQTSIRGWIFIVRELMDFPRIMRFATCQASVCCT